MKGNIYTWILLTVAMLTASCTRETPFEPQWEEGVPALIRVGSRNGSVNADDEIKSLRILAFAPGGSLRSNEFYTVNPEEGSSVINHQINSGLYDFVFVANENDGAELQALSLYSGKKTGLNVVHIPASMFSSLLPTASPAVPMLTEVDNVVVLPGTEGVKVAGSEAMPTWAVTMKKLAVRIDMVLKAKVDLSNLFEGVEFSNLPQGVPLTGEYTGNLSEVRVHSLSGGQSHSFEAYTPTIDEIEEGFVWGIKVKRVILPSHLFLPKNTASKALKMSVMLTSWAEYPSTEIANNEPDDYTLPPDARFTGEGRLGSLLSVYLTSLDWTEVDTGGSVDMRILNVSELEKTLPEGSTWRVYLNSNQKTVVVEPLAIMIGVGDDVAVTNIFDNPIVNYIYTPATKTGTGYIDLKAKNGVAGVYYIFLDANGLRRRIAITITN